MSFATTKAKIGFGTSFSYSTNLTTPAYTPLAEIISITPAKPKVAKVEASRMDSNTLPGSNLPIEDNIPGWVDPGEWTIKFVYDSGATVAAAIFALVGQELACKVLRPDTKGYTFQGYISEFGDEIPLKDRMTIEIKLTINGGSVMTAI